MSRSVVLSVLVAVGALSLGVAANQPEGEMVVEVERLADNLFVLRGGGGNSAAFVTSSGVVLVDTKLAGWGQPVTECEAHKGHHDDAKPDREYAHVWVHGAPSLGDGSRGPMPAATAS